MKVSGTNPSFTFWKEHLISLHNLRNCKQVSTYLYGKSDWYQNKLDPGLK